MIMASIQITHLFIDASIVNIGITETVILAWTLLRDEQISRTNYDKMITYIYNHRNDR